MAEEESIVETTTTTSTKKDRKKKEKKKRKKHKNLNDGDDGDSDEPMDVGMAKDTMKDGKDGDKIPKKKKKKEVKARLKSKKEEKAELMKKVPLTNEEGLAYTKFQIRQMMKRVKRGLPPVPTAKELDEKRQNEARLRREEEAELAGLVSTRNVAGTDEDNDRNSEDEDDDKDVDVKVSSDDEKAEQESKKNIDPSSEPPDASYKCVPTSINEDGIAKKKSKSKKPVPSDYICQACKNRHTPAHWIYDCPDKITVRGTNKKRKKERGIHDPDPKKVFVSGLPFDVKTKTVEDFFSVIKNCGTVAYVKLLHFQDTKRCNGQGYISFDTEEGAQRAIQLSGIVLDPEALLSSSDKTKKSNKESSVKRKQLKLKVSKALNRIKTKRS